MSQQDLFPDAASPRGLTVVVPDACKCGERRATIGAGAGPHVAALHCCRCGLHRGWVPHETHDFIAELIRDFGRPTTPISIRRQGK
jgi:hypothetical protein